MVDIVVHADGLKAPDAVELVTKPLETIVKAISGVEHVYSQARDDRSVATVRFNVGTNEDDAVLRVNDKIRANIDKIPIGIPEPLIVGRGINDVAVVVLTLSPQPSAAERWTDKDLYNVAVKLRSELTKVDDIGTSTIVGTGAEEIRVEPDPEKLSLFGVTLQQLVEGARPQPRLCRRSRARRRHDAHAGSGPDAVRRAGHWAAAADCARRAAGLSARCSPDGDRTEHRREPSLDPHADAGWLAACAGSATVSIAVLIALVIGWREAVVTLVVIPTAILLTLLRRG